jgi:outer membrane protein OmpA-like peptidoglycan-associated protein
MPSWLDGCLWPGDAIMRRLTSHLLTLASSAAFACVVAAVWLHDRHVAYGTSIAAVFITAVLLSWRCVHRHRRAMHYAASTLAGVNTGLYGGLHTARNMPCFVVIGEGLADIFDRHGLERRQRLEQGASWYRVDDPEQLGRTIDALDRLRRRPVDGLVIALAPARHACVEDMAEAARRLERAVEHAGQRLRRVIPCHVALYHPLGMAPAGAPFCRGIAFDSASRSGRGMDALRRGIEAEGRREAGATGGYRAARFDALLRCSAQVGTTHRDVPRMLAWLDAGPEHSGRDAVGRWMAAASGVLPGPVAATARPWPLPHAMAAHVSREPWIAGVPRAWAWITALAGLAIALAWAGSAHNNLRWLRHDRADLLRFAQTAPQAAAAKQAALTALLDDRKRLDRHRLTGIPLALGLGLYREHAVRLALDHAIASYVPPAPPPILVSLDAMSLFDSGSAALRPGSSRLLVKALADIGGHPDKRVLIAGHTDDVGDAEANRRLSLARAAAVRDWLIEASGMTAERFATQGYGKTRPLADNRTAEGRARNRRVEISLVAEATAP